MGKRLLNLTVPLAFILIALYCILIDFNTVKIATKSPDNTYELTIKTFLLEKSLCQCYSTISIVHDDNNGHYRNSIHYAGRKHSEKIEAILDIIWSDSSVVYQAELSNGQVVFDTLSLN